MKSDQAVMHAVQKWWNQIIFLKLKVTLFNSVMEESTRSLRNLTFKAFCLRV